MSASAASSGARTLLDLHMRVPPVAEYPKSRHTCPICKITCKYACPVHFIPTVGEYPLSEAELPIHCHVIRGKDEKGTKSTSLDIITLAPKHTSLALLPARSVCAEKRHMKNKRDEKIVSATAAVTEGVASEEAAEGATTSHSRVTQIRNSIEEVIPNPKRALVLFPSPTAKYAHELENLDDYDTLIAVDTTWSKTGATIAAMKLAELPFQHVKLSKYHTLFWRHQPMGPQCLATVEAVYFFMREFHVEKRKRQLLATPAPSYSIPLQSWPCVDTTPFPADRPASLTLTEEDIRNIHPTDPDNILYNGEADPLMTFFLINYKRIQFEYTEGAQQGKKFTKRMREGYIRGSGADSDDSAASPKASRFRGAWAIDGEILAEEGKEPVKSLDPDSFINLVKRVRDRQAKQTASPPPPPSTTTTPTAAAVLPPFE